MKTWKTFIFFILIFPIISFAKSKINEDLDKFKDINKFTIVMVPPLSNFPIRINEEKLEKVGCKYHIYEQEFIDRIYNILINSEFEINEKTGLQFETMNEISFESKSFGKREIFFSRFDLNKKIMLARAGGESYVLGENIFNKVVNVIIDSQVKNANFEKNEGCRDLGIFFSR